MSRLIRLLTRTGLAITNPFYPARSYHRPRKGDSRGDFSRVVGDMRRVGNDLRKVADKELGRHVGK